MKFEEILKTYFDFTDQDIKDKSSVLSHAYIVDIDKILAKTNFYMNEFNLTKQEFIKIIKKQPTLLNLSEEGIKAKTNFYRLKLNLNKQQFIKMLKSCPAVLAFSEENIESKTNFYKKEFRLSDDEFVKIIKTAPTLFAFTEESIIAKKEFYIKEFDLTEQEFIKLIKISPSLLIYSEESVKTKLDFYLQELGLNKFEFVKMLKTQPSLLDYSESSIKSKVEFYMQELNMNKQEFVQMLKSVPVLLGLSEQSLREKFKQIKELGIPKEFIMSSPMILIVPQNTLKIRYLILRQVATREEIFTKNWYTTNQNKIYARVKFLTTEVKNKKILSNCLRGEQEFCARFKITSEELMNKYALTTDVIAKMLENIEDEEIYFNADEEEYLKQEYGV